MKDKKSVVVFGGPTLKKEDISKYPDFLFLPPVSQGDVYRIALARPKVIGIIDGYFEGQPAVWHKEILWAISRGICVYGSASMGALRAAELHKFGMKGVGSIFEQFHSGELKDDDEVAIIHGDRSIEYKSASEAMVNIRSTIEAAQANRIISRGTGKLLLRTAKALFYSERTYNAIIRIAEKTCRAQGELEKFRRWLTVGKIDQKRIDALRMLETIKQEYRTCKPHSFERERFSHTQYWSELVRTTMPLNSAEINHDFSEHRVSIEDVLNELRLQDVAYQRAGSNALIRLLVLGEHRKGVASLGTEKIRQLFRAFRLKNSLRSKESLMRWLAANDLSEAKLKELLIEDEVIASTYNRIRKAIPSRLIEELKLSNMYGSLKRRAHAKRKILTESGLQNVSLEMAKMERSDLLRWFFQQSHGRIPVNLATYCGSLDLEQEPLFLRIALDEYHFQKLRRQRLLDKCADSKQRRTRRFLLLNTS